MNVQEFSNCCEFCSEKTSLIFAQFDPGIMWKKCQKTYFQKYKNIKPYVHPYCKRDAINTRHSLEAFPPRLRHPCSQGFNFISRSRRRRIKRSEELQQHQPPIHFPLSFLPRKRVKSDWKGARERKPRNGNRAAQNNRASSATQGCGRGRIVLKGMFLGDVKKLKCIAFKSKGVSCTI